MDNEWHVRYSTGVRFTGVVLCMIMRMYEYLATATYCIPGSFILYVRLLLFIYRLIGTTVPSRGRHQLQDTDDIYLFTSYSFIYFSIPFLIIFVLPFPLLPVYLTQMYPLVPSKI